MVLPNMQQILIVAYGNPMRCDDGVAWRAADNLEKEFHSPDVQVLRLHQLTPELAETVSQFQRVIFVDAASAEQSQPGEIRIEALPAADSSDATRFSHVLSPKTVVALAAGLYGAQLRAFSATVTGENFGHGESLSAPVAAALPELVAQIATLVRESLSNS
jgi:hydrogenase maturation protease